MPLFGGPPKVEKLKSRGSVKGLIRALDYENDFAVRRDAARALGEIGNPRAVEPLIIALRDGEWVVRRAAALALGSIGEVRALEPLIATLQDPVAVVRMAITEALGWIGDPRAADPLSRGLKDTESKVRKASVQALDKLGWKPNRGEVGAYYWAAKEEWDRCVEIGAPAIPALIHAVNEGDQPEQASRALSGIQDPQALEPLLVALKDEGWRVRRAVVDALRDFGDRRVVNSLIAALEDEDWGVRCGAARALGIIGDPRAVQPLITTLMEKGGYGQDSARLAAAWSLGRIGDERAIEPLIVVLGEIGDSLPSTAAEALGEIGVARVVEPLIQALDQEKVLLRGAAATALGKIGDPRAMESLMRAFKDGVYQVHSAAGRALEQIGVPAIDPLLATLEDKGWQVRLRAAQVLGEIGDLRCVGSLIKAIRDLDGGVQSSAVEALIKLVEPAIERVTVEDLRVLARLEDTIGIRHISSVCANEPSEDMQWTVDCSRLRQLARQELIRRGIGAQK